MRTRKDLQPSSPAIRQLIDQLLVALACLICLVGEGRAAVSEWHVAPAGDDAADGSVDRPFASLERARDAARAARAEVPDGAATFKALIQAQPGIYRRTAPLLLDERDSGLRIVGAAGQATRLHLGRFLRRADFHRVTNQRVLSRVDRAAREALVVADLQAAGLDPVTAWPDTFNDGGGLPDLFWHDRPLPLARWPNDAPTTMQKVLDRGDWPSRRPGSFVAREDRLARWNVADGLWLEGYWRVPWEPGAIRVKSIDVTHRTVTFAAPIFGGIGSKYARNSALGDGKEPWWAINLLEEIDRPGEWCLHFPSQTLYLWPPEGWNDEPDAPVFIAQGTEPIIQVDNAAAISIERLSLEGSLGDGVTIEGGCGNRVAGCRLMNLGGDGVVIRGGREHTVISCDLHTLGGAGIRLSGGERATLTPCGHEATNNHIHEVGRRQKTYAAAIHVGFAKSSGGGGEEAVGCRVTQNLMHDLPHAAVLYAGNDHLFEGNEIGRVALTSHDVGAFYTRFDWTSQGNIIRHNFVHSSPQANAFYLDDGDSGDTVTGNVVMGCAAGPFLGGGHHNQIRDNLIIDCEVGVHVDARGVSRAYATNERLLKGFAAVHPDQLPWSRTYPGLAALAGTDAGLPHGNLITGTITIGCPTPLRVKASAEQVADNTISPPTVLPLTAIGFSDRAGLRRSLLGSTFWQGRLPQLAPIPFDRIGLQRDDFRETLPARGAWLGRQPSLSAAGRDASMRDILTTDR